MSIVRSCAFAVAVGAAVASSLAASTDEGDEPPWEVVTVEAGRIAVPRGWRDFDFLQPPLFRQGDGLGVVPPVDETGSPLQIGISVEKLPEATQSIEEIVVGLVERAKQLPNLELVSDEVTTLKLADGTDAALLKVLLVKDGSRRSLQMKLVAKGKDETVWIVTGHIVGGLESAWPTPGSRLAQWLAAHMTSFTPDGEKFDAAKVRAAYEP